MTSRPGQVFVALLRGINVGGKNRLPMAELVQACEALGWREVRTYIQSGNLVFRAEEPRGESLQAEIERRFGLRVPVVLRSADAMAGVLAGVPFAELDREELHVGFLAEPPSAERLAKLDPARSPGDRFAVVSGEIYLHLPNGVARTKLTNDYFDRALGTVCTVRNWNTVEALARMARE